MNINTNYIESSPIKYLSNVDAFSMIQNAKEILALSNLTVYDVSTPARYATRITYRNKLYTGDELVVLLQEAALMKAFAEKHGTSRRLLPIYKLIQLVFETSNFCPIRGFRWQDNLVLSALRDLYAPYRDFPYKEVDTRPEFRERVSMILPEITFALVELWLKYTLLDITTFILEWATTSLDERLLGFKDSRVNFSKILIEHTEVIRGIRHICRGVSGIIVTRRNMVIKGA